MEVLPSIVTAAGAEGGTQEAVSLGVGEKREAWEEKVCGGVQSLRQMGS